MKYRPLFSLISVNSSSISPFSIFPFEIRDFQLWRKNGDICVRVLDEEGHVILAKSVKPDVSVMRSIRRLRYAEGMTDGGQLY
jgi:hypothetical protein